MNSLLIVALAVGIAVLLKIRASQSESGNASPPRPTQRKKRVRQVPAEDAAFKAVEIKPGINACEAALAMQGERFLSRDAPLTPLQDCTAEKCTCKYVHYRDRRQDFDRRDPLEVGWRTREALGETNRRSRRPRRKDDSEEGNLDIFGRVEFT